MALQNADKKIQHQEATVEALQPREARNTFSHFPNAKSIAAGRNISACLCIWPRESTQNLLQIINVLAKESSGKTGEPFETSGCLRKLRTGPGEKRWQLAVTKRQRYRLSRLLIFLFCASVPAPRTLNGSRWFPMNDLEKSKSCRHVHRREHHVEVGCARIRKPT